MRKEKINNIVILFKFLLKQFVIKGIKFFFVEIKLKQPDAELIDTVKIHLLISYKLIEFIVALQINEDVVQLLVAIKPLVCDKKKLTEQLSDIIEMGFLSSLKKRL